MDWASDNEGINEKDLRNVFRYEEKPTTVVRMLEGLKGPEIWSLEGETEWNDWIHTDCPDIDGSASGLVLILAKRAGELAFRDVKRVQSRTWLERINKEMPERLNTQRTFASLTEKNQGAGSQSLGIGSGRRSVRTLPFSQSTFQLITSKFYTHRSIARDISRADVPVFSSAEVQMGEPAYPAYGEFLPLWPDDETDLIAVYNCRSTNAWEMDLALTVTYFPRCGLTYAILFGCPLSLEEDIVKRLSLATAEAAHPLLMPGIFTEIERSRHVHVVDATVNELESRVFELDFQSDRASIPRSEAERRNQEKRTAWLDATYLRNALISWNTQVAKINDHADELQRTVFEPHKFEETVRGTENIFNDHSSNLSTSESKPGGAISSTQFELSEASCEDGLAERQFDNVQSWKENQSDSREFKNMTMHCNTEASHERMRRVGNKIKNRIQDIIDEYDDKIRDCTMRIDGMAMATRWDYSDTNVEIALATSRESKYMRSIAIVTMVFLPGTFFASVFSMTFFNWSSGGSHISSYIWIYVIVTVCFTLLTIGTWWYLVIYRPSRPQKLTDEQEIPLI